MMITMEADEMVSFCRSIRGVTIRCDNGVVWITVAGDRSDHILSAGQEFTVPNRGKAVIVAGKRASLRLFRPLTEGVPVRSSRPALWFQEPVQDMFSR